MGLSSRVEVEEEVGGGQTTLDCSSTLRLRRGPRSSEVEVSAVQSSAKVFGGEGQPGVPLASDGSVTGAGGRQLTKRIDYRARWREWSFLAIYIKDAIVGPVYDPILEPKTGGTKRPVVLVPGWCGRTRSFERMRDRLHQAGHPVYPIPLGSQLGCIDRKANLLTAFLDKHELDDVYVVAHSMGGLITVRSLMKGEKRIRKAITLGTPYRGTYLIYPGYCLSIAIALALSFGLAPAVGLFYFFLFTQIPSLWQMMPNSPFLYEVLTYLGQTDRVQCVYSIADQVVIHNWRRIWAPTRLHRENDVCIPEFGHMALFMSDTAIEEVVQIVDDHEKGRAPATLTSPLVREQPVLVCKCCGVAG